MLLLRVAGSRQRLLPPGLLSAEAGITGRGVPLVRVWGSRQLPQITPQAGCCWETHWCVPSMTLPSLSRHGVAQPGLIPSGPVAGDSCCLLVSARHPGRLKWD